MRCDRCGAECAESARFCSHCGNPLRPRCPVCRKEHDGNASFCIQCGTSLESAGAAAASPLLRRPAAGPARTSPWPWQAPSRPGQQPLRRATPATKAHPTVAALQPGPDGGYPPPDGAAPAVPGRSPASPGRSPASPGFPPASPGRPPASPGFPPVASGLPHSSSGLPHTVTRGPDPSGGALPPDFDDMFRPRRASPPAADGEPLSPGLPPGRDDTLTLSDPAAGMPPARPGQAAEPGARQPSRRRWLPAIWVTCAILVLVGGGYELVHLVQQGSAPPGVPSAPGPRATPSRSPSPAVVAWIAQADQVLKSSASVRFRLEDAVVEARHGEAGAARALSGVGAVIRQRSALLRRVESWHAPLAARRSQALLTSSLAASLASDRLYRRWAAALRAGHRKEARALLAQAAAQDGRTVALKREFLRSFDALRAEADEQPLGPDYLF
jgi:hypothetical protein